jgi:SAM-dependent methyltransferase
MDDDRDLDLEARSAEGSLPKKRRAARGLRVPNDPVPSKAPVEVQPAKRRLSAEDEFEDHPTELIDQSQVPQTPGTSSVAQAPVIPIPPLDLSALREAEHGQTALDSPSSSVSDQSKVEVLHELNAAPDDGSQDAEVEFTSDGVDGHEDEPVAKPKPQSDEHSVVVRHVRRKIIRAIGEDFPDDPTLEMPAPLNGFSIPPPVKLPDIAVEATQESAAAVAQPAADHAEVSPTPSEHVDASESLTDPQGPPRLVLVSLPPPPPTPSSKSADSALPTQVLSLLDEMESLDASARPIAAIESVSTSILESMETDVVVEESGDDHTEEISIPDEILLAKPAPSIPPAPPRPSIADGERPPPPPPPQARATVPDSTSKPSGQPSAKPKRRQWWEEIFNDDYLRTVPKFTAEQASSECDFIEASLGVERGATILDVGCGTGRQALELASRGYEVMGLDLSLPMLTRASDEAQQRGLKINFVQADMCEIDFNESFDAAFCVGSTYGFFDDDKNNHVIERLHRALKPGGTLLLEVVNRDCAAGQHPGMVWYEGEGCVCMEETNFNWVTSRLEGKRTLLMEDGRQKEQKFSLRLYSLHELGRSLHSAGFRVIEVSGHPKTPGAFFGTNSTQLIILAQKRAADG